MPTAWYFLSVIAQMCRLGPDVSDSWEQWATGHVQVHPGVSAHLQPVLQCAASKLGSASGRWNSAKFSVDVVSVDKGLVNGVSVDEGLVNVVSVEEGLVHELRLD